LLDEDRRALAAAARVRAPIARAAVLAARALAAGGRIVFLGAGTSGRLGILEAAECPPTFGTDPDRIRAVMAGGPGAVFRAVEGAEDRAPDGAREGRRLRRGRPADRDLRQLRHPVRAGRAAGGPGAGNRAPCS
jgi:N-acetylmuramic acid 6-phosphate etherase